MIYGSIHQLCGLFLISAVGAATAIAARPIEKRTEADYILTGKVRAVYKRNTEGYTYYIIEVGVTSVEKGKGIKAGQVFRAFCYQRKTGKGGIEFDTSGHNYVPKEGATVKMFVKQQRGRNEGIYPHWVDVIK